MVDTPRLKLPLLSAAQAQKHVTHNEAILMLDLLTGIIVVSNRSLTTPAGGEVDGEGFILTGAGTGAWDGYAADDLALRIDGGWRRVLPSTGMLATIADEAGAIVRYDGANWVSDAGSTEFADDVFRVTDNGDATKKLAFQASGIATATTRTLTAPDASGTIALTSGLGATDNAVLRADGTGATTAQASTATLSDTGFFTAAGYMLDATGVFELSSGVVRAGFDTGDTLQFDRGTNVLTYAIGGTSRFTWSTAGFRPAADNVVGVGASGLRFTSVWAATGTIQTSDAREKEVQPDASEALNSGAASLIDAIDPVIFRWFEGGKDEVETGEFDEHLEPVFEAVDVDDFAIEIVGGVAVRLPIRRIERRQVFDVYPVVDAAGAPLVREAGRTDKGEPILEAVTHSVPRMAVVRTPRTELVSRPGQRLHAGILAQDLKAELDRLGLDFGVWGLADPHDPGSQQWLRPDQLIPILWAALKATREELGKLLFT